MAVDMDITRRAASPTGFGLGLLLRRVRMWFLLRFKHRLQSVGRSFYIGYGTHIRGGCVSVGDYCFIGSNCHIATQAKIGNWVMIASGVSMVGGDHDFSIVGTPSIHAGRGENKEIVIEDDTWIGCGAIIMHGVHIGEGAIIAAGAIVSRDVPAYSIFGNKPAEQIGMRFSEEDILHHQASLKKLRKHLGKNQ